MTWGRLGRDLLFPDKKILKRRDSDSDVVLHPRTRDNHQTPEVFVFLASRSFSTLLSLFLRADDARHASSHLHAGKIPAELGRLSKLLVLELHDNQLFGKQKV